MFVKIALGVVLLASCAGTAGFAQDASGLRPSDPCAFYRSQAWQKGLDHFAQDMLWSCEAISRRRGAGMPLPERLATAAEALESYRAEVVRLARRRFQEDRARGVSPFGHHMSDDEKRQIAQDTGVLEALAAIANAF